MDRLQSRLFAFSAGFATDFPALSRGLDYFLKAENVIYEVSGGSRKVGGADKINSTQISGGPDVLGMFDFWFGNPLAQQFIVVANGANAVVYKEISGTLTNI